MKSPCSNHANEEPNRKEYPLFEGLMKYFPDALMDVSHVSFIGNEQHNPGEPLHWSKHKSNDHKDALLRHLLDAGKFDDDGLRHSAKAAWRSLAALQIEIEKERNVQPMKVKYTYND